MILSLPRLAHPPCLSGAELRTTTTVPIPQLKILMNQTTTMRRNFCRIANRNAARTRDRKSASLARLAIAAGVAITFGQVGGATRASAAVIDDFSSSNPQNYTQLNVYNTGFAFGTNGTGQFAPTYTNTGSSYGSQAVFYRNTGELLGAAGGDAVSIQINQITGSNATVGLGFGTSTTTSTTTTTGFFETFIRRNDSTYRFGFNGENGQVVITGFDLSSPAVLSVARETADPTMFQVTISGGGLLTPFTQTIQPGGGSFSQALFFGPSQYSGGGGPGSPGAAPSIQDDLSFAPVPEPSTALALLGGTATLLGLRRRRA